MQQVPIYISIVFVLTTFYAIFMFWKASNYSRLVLTILVSWLVVQGGISLTLFYTDTSSLPPRFLLLILPAFAVIAIIFLTGKGRKLIAELDDQSLILLNTVRIPVEIVLFWLFTYKAIPQVMTFEGTNFDILAGLSAPVIWYLYRKGISNNILLAWNIAGLVLLANIIATAILAAPTPFQQLAHTQPNIAVMYFPFVWLPCCVVPLVLFSHLVLIKKAMARKAVYASVV